MINSGWMIRIVDLNDPTIILKLCNLMFPTGSVDACLISTGLSIRNY
jgi:hypothetical protein